MHLYETQSLVHAELKCFSCDERDQARTIRVKATNSDNTRTGVRTQNSTSVGDTVWAQRWVAPWGVIVVAVATLFSVSTLEVTAFIPDFLEWGHCSNVKLQEDFDPVKYQGLWWDIARVPNEYQKASACLGQNISWTGTALEVVNSGLTTAGEKSGAFASMVEEPSRSPPSPAHMTVTSEGVPAAPYQVMSTDYSHYSCVYSCLQFPGVFAEFFWIFGRTPTLSKEFQQICLDLFEDAGINTDKLVQVKQGESCPYYPHLPQLEGYNTNLLNELQSGAEEYTNSIFDTGRSHKLSHSAARVSSLSAAPPTDSVSSPTSASSIAPTSSLLLLLSLLMLLPLSVWLVR